jgi:hypothetical protein
MKTRDPTLGSGNPVVIAVTLLVTLEARLHRKWERMTPSESDYFKLLSITGCLRVSWKSSSDTETCCIFVKPYPCLVGCTWPYIGWLSPHPPPSPHPPWSLQDPVPFSSLHCCFWAHAVYLCEDLLHLLQECHVFSGLGLELAILTFHPEFFLCPHDMGTYCHLPLCYDCCREQVSNLSPPSPQG